MVKVQILDDDFGVELVPRQDISFPITKTLSNLKDISSRSGSFSKSIFFPGTKDNNLAFGQLYDINLSTGEFDRKALNRCIVYSDDTVVFEGYLRLLRIVKSSEESVPEKKVQYECTVYNGVSTFYQEIQGREMSELDLSAFNHLYTASAVTETWADTWNYQSGYTYCLPYLSEGDNEYLLNEFRPAIYAKVLWDKIFDNAGYTYTWSSQFDNDIQFDKLVLPYAGEAPALSPEDFEIYFASAQYTSAVTYNTPPNAAVDGIQESWRLNSLSSNTEYINAYEIPADENEIDQGNNYNDTTFVYESPIDTAPNQGFAVKVVADVRFQLINDTGAPAYLRRQSFSEGNPSPERGYEYAAYIRILNTDNDSFYSDIGSQVVATVTSINSDIYQLAAGDTEFFNERVEFNILMSGLDVGNKLKLGVDLICNGAAFNVDDGLPVWASNEVGTPTQVTITQELELSNIEVQFYPEITDNNAGAIARINDYVPKMSQKDFLQGIIKMYNLYIDVNEEDDKALVIKTRDDYYDEGSTIDWTDKILTNKEQRISFASNDSGRNKLFTYKEGKDEINKVYQDTIQQTYGQYTFVLGDKNLRGEDKIELPFQPMPIVKSSIGAFTLPVNGFEPKTEQGIVVKGEKKSSGQFSIIENYVNQDLQQPIGELNITEYRYFGHMDDPTEANFELNYGHPAYLLYDDNINITSNNLFNLHWRRTVTQIDNGKVLVAYFDLSSADFRNVSLDDTIFIYDTAYNIVEISDFNAAKTQPTKVKLITADDELTIGNHSQVPEVIADDAGGNDGPIAVPGEEGNGGPLAPFGASNGPNPVPQLPGPGQFPNQPNIPSGARFRSEALGLLDYARTRSQNVIKSNGYNVVMGKYNYIGPGANNNIVQGNANYIDNDVVYTQTIGNDNVIEGNYNNTLGNNNEIIGDYNNIQGDDLVVTGSNETIVSGELQITGGTDFDILVSSGGTVGFTDAIDLDLVDNNVLIMSTDSEITGSTNSGIFGGSGHNLFDFGQSLILGGQDNVSQGGGQGVSIMGSRTSTADTASYSSIISSSGSTIDNSQYSSIIASQDNEIKNTTTRSVILAGFDNIIDDCFESGIFASRRTVMSGDSRLSAIIGSTGTTMDNSIGCVDISSTDNTYDEARRCTSISSTECFLDGAFCFVASSINVNMKRGVSSSISSVDSSIGYPATTLISSSGITTGFFFPGTEFSTAISSTNSIITGNTRAQTLISTKDSIIDACPYSSVLGGENTILKDSEFAAIVGGKNNLVRASNLSFIAGGDSNTITGSARSCIIGGSSHQIINNGSFLVDNIIAGGSDNVITTNTNNNNSGIFAGNQNSISSCNFSSIVGGNDNIVRVSNSSLIAGGSDNTITGSPRSCIIAGTNNKIEGALTERSIIAGGNSNTITSSQRSCIIGGTNNKIEGALTERSIIAGSNNCVISGSSLQNFIGGGDSTVIEGSSDFNAVLANFNSTITNNSNFNIIGGGAEHTIDDGEYSSIIGGQNNTVSSANRSVVIGGQNLSATTNDTVVVPFLSINDFADFAPRASAPTAVEGRVYYDSTLNKLRCYDGTTWQDLF